MFTDERQGVALWAALAKLRRGDLVVFRHYDAPDRAGLAARVRAAARRRGAVFIVAGHAREARAWRADGHHRPTWARARGWLRPGLRTAPAHNRVEVVRARRDGAGLAFVSPVFATASHAGARSLGRLGFGLIARGARMPVAALGGVTPRRARHLRALGAAGWGAVDGFI